MVTDDVITTLGPPGGGPRGLKIWTRIFLDMLVPNQPKKAIKSILANKSHGNTQHSTLLGKASEKLQRVDEPLWLKSEALQHAMEDMKERSTESIVDHGTLCSHIDDIRVSKFKGFAIS